MSETLQEKAVKAANRMRDNHKEVCRVMMPHADEPKLWEESSHLANVMARYILSPPAPGPSAPAETPDRLAELRRRIDTPGETVPFDEFVSRVESARGSGFGEEGFVDRVFDAAWDEARTWDEENDGSRDDGMKDKFVAELRAALAAGSGDDEKPLTNEWLIDVGAPNGTLSWAGVRYFIRYDLGQFGQVMCFTRGDVRRVCRLAGIPLPAPNERTVSP